MLVLDGKLISSLDVSRGKKGSFDLHHSLQVLLLQCITNGLGADIEGEVGLDLGGIINLPRGDRTSQVATIPGGELGRTTSERCWKWTRELGMYL
jgi:hypothetical protein